MLNGITGDICIAFSLSFWSSDFERHEHPKETCELIVCWEMDNDPNGIDIIELKHFWKMKR
jgi:hypothetical protein